MRQAYPNETIHAGIQRPGADCRWAINVIVEGGFMSSVTLSHSILNQFRFYTIKVNNLHQRSRQEMPNPTKSDALRPRPIWEPTIPQDQIPMNIYRAHINKKFNQQLRSSHDLHQWSVENLQDFWTDLHGYTGIIPPLPPTVTSAFDPSTPMDKVPKFFRGATVNYAENVMSGRDLNKTALVGVREGQDLGGEVWTWGLLRENVRKARSALLQLGVKERDRVAAIISNSVWSVGMFLATVSIGAIWTSIAPDLGEEVCFEGMGIAVDNRD